MATKKAARKAREEGRKEEEVAAIQPKGNTSGERFQRSPVCFLGQGLVFLGKGLHW